MHNYLSAYLVALKLLGWRGKQDCIFSLSVPQYVTQIWYILRLQ